MEQELRYQILKAAVKDRTFLKAAWRDIQPEDFPEKPEQIIAKAAVTFYEKYEEPVGSMLRSDAEDIALQERIGADGKRKLKLLLDTILGTKMENVSVKALEDRVKALKRTAFYDSAVDEILNAQDQDKLTAETLATLVERANKELYSNGVVTRDYFNDIEGRIIRRKHWDEGHKYPWICIDPLDEKIKMLGRGQFGIFIGSYNSGKGLALIHVATAYLLQGLNVLYLTLEDPLDMVENRFDASLTGIPLNKLNNLPIKLKNRFLRMKRLMRGKIHIIDGTDGGWSISRIEQEWDHLRQRGFVADAIIIDYDDEIECEKQFKGESARRFEFAEIYRRMRRLAVKTDTIVWSAAQTKAKGEKQKVIRGTDAAEDISKVRKAFLAIGIGQDKNMVDKKFLYVARHRGDRSRFGVTICTDFESAIFYDREATEHYYHMRRKRNGYGG